MTVYGYWRCSTDLQNQERQVLAMKQAGCQDIYGDKITGTSDCLLNGLGVYVGSELPSGLLNGDHRCASEGDLGGIGQNNSLPFVRRFRHLLLVSAVSIATTPSS